MENNPYYVYNYIHNMDIYSSYYGQIVSKSKGGI